MRDPERIGPMIDEIHRHWAGSPQQRLMQLLINAAQRGQTINSTAQLYNLEDEELMRRLDPEYERPETPEDVRMRELIQAYVGLGIDEHAARRAVILARAMFAGGWHP